LGTPNPRRTTRSHISGACASTEATGWSGGHGRAGLAFRRMAQAQLSFFFYLLLFSLHMEGIRVRIWPKTAYVTPRPRGPMAAAGGSDGSSSSSSSRWLGEGRRRGEEGRDERQA
jgi:hypothetical protein